MKRLVLLAFILCAVVQAQTIGTWGYFGSTAGRYGIRTTTVTDAAQGVLIFRCDADTADVYLIATGKGPPAMDFILPSQYQIDFAPYANFGFDPGQQSDTGFFQEPEIKTFVTKFLTAHYFTAVVSFRDYPRSFTFDLTGFGQSLQYIPCFKKYLP